MPPAYATPSMPIVSQDISSTETITSAERSHTSRDRTDDIMARAFPWAILPTSSHPYDCHFGDSIKLGNN